MADVKWRQWNTISQKADLIDRAALLADIDEAIIISGRLGETNAEMRGANKVTHRIKVAKAVDAVEVVRCKDCKSWTRHSGVASYSPTGLCSTWADTTLGVDFCSYGERRTDGSTD